MALIYKASCLENSAVVLMARVSDVSGTDIVQSDIESITCNVYDSTTGVLLANPTYDVADVIYDTLQTDSRWTADSTGFNFAAVIPASALSSGSQRVRVEFLIVPADGGTDTTTQFYIIYELSVVEVFSE
jgi:hypothetical protein